MEKMSFVDPWTAQALSPPLSLPEQEFREAFVREYVKDYDGYSACIRLGILDQYASEYAERLLGDSLVLQLVESYEVDFLSNPDKQKRWIYTQLRREAVYRGPDSKHAARIGALAKLADFMGMNAPTKSNVTVEAGSKVVVYVPDNGRDGVVK